MGDLIMEDLIMGDRGVFRLFRDRNLTSKTAGGGGGL